jgi:hypothetical protein
MLRKKSNKKKLVILILAVIFVAGFFGFGINLSAQTDAFGLEQVGETTLLGSEDIRLTIAKIIRVILGFLGIAALCIMLYGGYVYMTAGGDEGKVSTAKKIIINGTIGLVIILSSFAITQFILNKLAEATGVVTGDVPANCTDLAYAAAHPDICSGGTFNPCNNLDNQFVVKSITPSMLVGSLGVNNLAIRSIFSQGLNSAINVDQTFKIERDGIDVSNEFNFNYLDNEHSVVEAVAPDISGMFGDGSDGDLTVASAGTFVNDYTYLTGNENSGDTEITVNSVAAFFEGDEIMIIQMQDGAGSGQAGKYEFKKIESISGNNIVLTSDLNRTYGSGEFNTKDASATQVIRVPHYTTVTVNSGGSIIAPAWNGYIGGVVVFRAVETVLVNSGGDIDVSGKGFRGGNQILSDYGEDGAQGESYPGEGILSYTENNKGGGGGGDGDYNNSPWWGIPGGGGGYGTKGGSYISRTIGGSVYGNLNLSRDIHLGSGGGAGSEPDGYKNGHAGDGGAGAGIIMIFSNDIFNFGSIHANGEEGEDRRR